MHTNIYITHVYARTCINTLACKLGHAAISETHMGTHTYVLTWIRVHTHDLLKAAPPAYGTAKEKKKEKKITRPGVVPAAEMTRPVLRSSPSERVDGYLCVGSHAQLDAYRSNRLEPRQTHSLTYPITHFSVVTCTCPAATPPFS